LKRGSELITCVIRYTLDNEKLADFEQYAQVWMRLVEEYGGTHHGYFVPHEAPPPAAFSFAGIGEDGPRNIAFALFSFPTIEAYEKYRGEVSDDPECQGETRHFQETKCFTKYERTFMRPVSRI
jgi:hypothetical protein